MCLSQFQNSVFRLYRDGRRVIVRTVLSKGATLIFQSLVLSIRHCIKIAHFAAKGANSCNRWISQGRRKCHESTMSNKGISSTSAMDDDYEGSRDSKHRIWDQQAIHLVTPVNSESPTFCRRLALSPKRKWLVQALGAHQFVERSLGEASRAQPTTHVAVAKRVRRRSFDDLPVPKRLLTGHYLLRFGDAT